MESPQNGALPDPSAGNVGPGVLYNQKAPNLEFQVASGPEGGSDEECVLGDPNPCSRI